MSRLNRTFILVGSIILTLIVGLGLYMVTRPNPCIPISIIYAPESGRYLRPAIEQFNKASSNRVDPSTNQPLPPEQPCIVVTGEPGSSGDIMQAIVNAIIAPGHANVKKPTIFMPAVSHWLSLANLQAKRPVFDLANSPATTQDPIVIAIWEDRLKAIQNAYPGQELGWKELLEVIKNPKGWEAYGSSGRSRVYYGHTDPFVSSSGLSTLIAEFYASARNNIGFTGRRLTGTEVKNTEVRDGVREIHTAIKHYSRRTTEFKNEIACGGPEYLDFVALPEDEFLQIAQAPNDEVACKPSERLVALYPREGTFYHEHPFAIVNAEWVTPEQRMAAEQFRNYVVSGPIQQLVLEGGFRPASTEVALTYPITTNLGVDPTRPQTVLDVPDPQVIRDIQQSWSYVKKQADIWLVIDISGSMNDGDKIGKARDAALAFLDNIEPQNRVGLITFNERVNTVVPIGTVEKNKPDLQAAIRGLQASGGTALFDGVLEGIQQLTNAGNNDRIRMVVLLSDGRNTDSKQEILDNIITQLTKSQATDENAILVVPIAYGSDADIPTLNSIASASKIDLFIASTTQAIRGIMEIIAGLD